MAVGDDFATEDAPCPRRRPKGLAYAVEVVGVHGLPFRLDGRTVNAGRTSFGLVGVQPTVEYNFTDRIVGAAGALYPLHPERRDGMPWSRWWDDPPRRPRGPHDGKPRRR